MEKVKTPKPTDKQVEPNFNAYAIVRGSDALEYRLIKLVMRGRQLADVEVISDEILPVVLAKAANLLRAEVHLE